MQTLIEGKQQNVPVRFQPSKAWVDCNAALQQAIDRLQPLIASKQFNLQVGRLPTLPGDEILLVQLFQTLIDRLLQAIGAEQSPLINVLASNAGGGWQFCIHSSGMNMQDEMILVDCRRIVEAHGGVFWIETHSGGTLLCFILPAAQP